MENESKLFLAKINDLIRLRDLRNISKFSGFLSPSEATIIETAIRAPNCFFFGGYKNAERRMFGALPYYIDEPFEEFPISALEFYYRKSDVLTHRDFLGSFMATGISRETIGDICVGVGSTVVFVANKVSEYLSEQIVKVGRVGVSVKKIDIANISDCLEQPQKICFSFTVSSLRLGTVLCGLVGCSRSKAESYICDRRVFVNSFEVTKTTKQIKTGDFITLRGIGKFLIVSCNGVTKKGREIITAEKYI